MLSTESLCKKHEIQIKNEPQQLKTNNQNLNQSNQQEKLQKQNKKVINFFRLYKYADRIDYALIFIGILLSVATGCGLPFFAVVAGNMIDAFQQINDQMLSKTATARNLFLYIGAGTFFAALLAVVTWMKVGERISLKCRKLYLQSLLKKNIKEVNKFADKKSLQQIQNDFIVFRQAIGFKVGSFIFIAASLVAGGRNAISTGWLLSLIMVSTLPLLGISGVLYTFFVQLKKTKIQKCYDEAQKRSQNVFSKLRQIKVLNGEKHQLSVYDKLCTFLGKKIMLFSSLVGVSAGWFSLVQFGVYALAFWFGSHCVEGSKPCQIHDFNDRYSPGEVIVIFFAFYVRLDSMQQILPTLRKIYGGMQAGLRIYSIIEYEENQNIENQQVKKQFNEDIGQGFIEFENVSLYEEQQGEVIRILNQVSMVLDKRLVSISGNRRQLSSMRDLILGLIEPNEGTIKVDGVNMQKLTMNESIKKMGYIGQQMRWLDSMIMNNLKDKLNIECKQDLIQSQQKQNQKQIKKLMKEFNIQHLIPLLNETQKYHQQRDLTYEERRRILVVRVLLNRPKIIVIDQIYQQGMDHLQYQIFNRIVLLSQANLIVYLGANPQIILSIQNRYHIINGHITLLKPTQLISSFLLFKCEQTQQPFIIPQPSACIIKKVSQQLVRKSPQIQELQQQKKIFQLYSYRFLLQLVPFIKQFKFTFFLGIFFSFLNGLLYPIFTIFLADILLQTFKFKNQIQQTSFIRQHIQRPVLVIVYIGISSFVFNLMENIIFSFLNQKIKHKIRIKTYKKLLNLPLNWYSSKLLHEPYIITKRLKQNGTQIASILTKYLPIIIKNTVSTISGLIIAFIFQWRIALLGFITLPMMMASGYLLMKFFNQNDPETQNKYKQSSSVIFQTTNNFRTIKVNGMQNLIKNSYGQKLSQCQNSSLLRSLVVGLKFGFSQFFIFVSFAILFYFGSVFLKENNQDMTVLSLFTAIFAVIWPGWTGGSNFFRAPDYDKCRKATCFYMDIMNSLQQKVIQNQKELNFKIKNNVQFVDIKTESNGQDIMINNLTLEVGNQQRLSYIVGHFQIIKLLIDTILGLHQFEGKILIDNVDFKQFDVKTLRSKIIFIEDDPYIFQGTLKQNILYNLSSQIDSQIQQLWKLLSSNKDQEDHQKVKFQPFQLNQLHSQKLTQKDVFFDLGTILSDDSNIPKDIKVKISLMRALLRKPEIIFISSKYGLDNKFYQKILQNDSRKRIKIILILGQENESLSNLKNQTLSI